MNWNKFEQEILSLSKLIDHKPDIIVGVVRGGIIPARLLSNLLKVKKMYCLSVEKHKNQRVITTEIIEDISNKSILLIEDMLETGKSMIVLKKYLETKGGIVETACLYTMPSSEIKPNYSLRKINKVQHFPWE